MQDLALLDEYKKKHNLLPSHHKLAKRSNVQNNQAVATASSHILVKSNTLDSSPFMPKKLSTIQQAIKRATPTGQPTASSSVLSPVLLQRQARAISSSPLKGAQTHTPPLKPVLKATTEVFKIEDQVEPEDYTDTPNASHMLLRDWSPLIDCIVDIYQEANGTLICLTNWKNGKKCTHTSELMQKKCPLMLIHFYEQHIRFY